MRLETDRVHEKDRPGMRMTGEVSQTVDMIQKETDRRHETDRRPETDRKHDRQDT